MARERRMTNEHLVRAPKEHLPIICRRRSTLCDVQNVRSDNFHDHIILHSEYSQFRNCTWTHLMLNSGDFKNMNKQTARSDDENRRQRSNFRQCEQNLDLFSGVMH